MKGSLFFFIVSLLLRMLEMSLGEVRGVDDLLGAERVSHLRFFLHDNTGGKNVTAVQIAQAEMTVKSPVAFGLLAMADHMLTDKGLHRDSKEIGRAQGMYGFAGLKEASLHVSMTLCFTAGEFAGSCISIMGRNQVYHFVREISVVGGTGAFRFARGYALAHTTYFSSDFWVVEYNVTVFHRLPS